MNIAIIPARGGSKRIEKKNIRPFCGKPIIHYSIEAALKCDFIDRVLVSTDCFEIKQVAEDANAEVPFMRPPELSDDFTPTIPVLRHAVEWATQHWGDVKLACCLYATAPFVQQTDLAKGFEKLSADPEAEFAFSVTEFSFPIFRALKIEEERTGMFWPEHELTRSQDLPQAYHDAGQFYWGRAEAFRTRDRFFSARSIPIVLPGTRVQDIDTYEDWARAEMLYKLNQTECVSKVN